MNAGAFMSLRFFLVKGGAISQRIRYENVQNELIDLFTVG